MVSMPANAVVPESGPRSLRILILGWMVGTGSTGVYISELANYLSEAGHMVTCLSAGACDWGMKPHLVTRQHQPFEIVELRNPPIMACARSADPADDITSPGTAGLLRDVLQRVRPEVVAIVDFPGWPARTVDICREMGSRVMVFLQNFWPFCTRLGLLDRWGNVCLDYQKGERCVECMGNVVGNSGARWRSRVPGALWRGSAAYSFLKGLYHAGVGVRRAVTTPSGASYAARRHAYAAAIGQADLVCGISQRTIDVAVSFGVAASNTRIVPIVLTHIRSIQAACENRAHPRASFKGPIRFAYLGAHVPEKGIETLIESFWGISAAEATLSCYGNGGREYLRHLGGLADPANPPTFHGAYRQADLPDILQDIDIGIVPSTCEDTRPNTVLEFQAAGIPVIGSRIGGIPEQIDHGRNGLLFDAGDAEALRSTLKTIIASPDLILGWCANLPTAFDPAFSWRQMENLFGEIATR